MKITKSELRQIIKEESQKILNENNPIRNAEYQRGNYANTHLVDKVIQGIDDLFENVFAEATEDLQDTDDADVAASNVVLVTVMEAFQRVGLIGQAGSLEKFLG